MIKKSGMTEVELKVEFQNASELIKDKAYVGDRWELSKMYGFDFQGLLDLKYNKKSIEE